MSTKAFVESITPAVLKDYQKTGVLPSITIAQAILESNHGKSSLYDKYNNAFGIKAGSSWKGESIALPTWEEVDGKRVSVIGKFRVYDSLEQSINDHSNLFWSNSRYTPFLEASKKGDYKTASHSLTGVYATDSNYGNSLISIIEQYGLDKLDKGQKIDDSVWDRKVENKEPDKEYKSGDVFDNMNPIGNIGEVMQNFFTETLPKMGWILVGILLVAFGIIFLFNEGGGGANE